MQNIAPYFENLDEHRKEEVAKSFMEQLKICCEWFPFKLREEFYEFVDAEWPFYTSLENTELLNRIELVQYQRKYK